MARIEDEDVEALVEVDDSISLTPFITAANELVTELCTDSGYSATRLAIIETWLAAHLYQMRDQAVAMEDAKGVRSQYQYKVGLYLEQTKYGQTAMLMDTAGNLAALSKSMEQGEARTVTIGWLGTDYDTEEEDE
jgi:hypothetical protein